MNSCRKNKGFVVIVAAVITTIGVLGAAGITAYYKSHNSNSEYKLLENDPIVSATNSTEEDLKFFALAGKDILASSGNVIPANSPSKIQIPTTFTNLVELLHRKIGGHFLYNDGLVEKTITCPMLELIEDVTFTALKYGDNFECNISKS